MNDFDYENHQKKVTARSARNRVGLHKGCTLPSDYMTPAQKKKLNGPVHTIQMGTPMTWDEFKAVDDSDLKRSYLIDLRDSHGANAKNIAKMFGVSRATVSRVINDLGLSFKTGRSSEADRERWESFVEQEAESDECLVDEYSGPESPEVAKPTYSGKPNSIRMEFDGRPAQEYLDSLWAMCDGKNAHVKVEVEVFA